MIVRRLFLMCLAFCAAACSQVLKPNGQTELTDIIQTQSRGLIQLVSYTKTNGIERDASGMHLYVVEYEAVIQFQDDIYWSGGNSGFGWSGQYCAYKRTATMKFLGVTMPSIAPPGYTTAAKGTRMKVQGELTYEMTDNGWIANYTRC